MKYIVGDIGNTSTRICLLNQRFLIVKSVIFDTSKIFEKKYSRNIFKKFLKKDTNSKLLFSSVVPLAFKKIKAIFKGSNYKIIEIKNLKIKKIKFEFSTSIGRGREVEFYNSLIFSLDVKKKNKFVNLISGGRFDELTSKFLGLKKVPAVGAAVNLSNYE